MSLLFAVWMPMGLSDQPQRMAHEVSRFAKTSVFAAGCESGPTHDVRL
jgi:hypothetical protein